MAYLSICRKQRFDLFVVNSQSWPTLCYGHELDSGGHIRCWLPLLHQTTYIQEAVTLLKMHMKMGWDGL